MARSDRYLVDRLLRRLGESVRPVGSPPERGEPAAAPPVMPRRAHPAAVDVDESALRTLIRPASAQPPGQPVTTASTERIEHMEHRTPAGSPEPSDQGPPAVRWAPRIAMRFERRHLVVIVVALSLAVVVGGWALLRARDHAAGAVPVALTTTTAPDEAGSPGAPTGTDPAPSSAASSASTTERLTVHVVGAVRKPGLVRLPTGARVADAIKAAGGLLDGAVPGRLNLAQRLQDGEQVYVSDSSERPSEVVAAGAGDGSGTGSEPGGTTGSTSQVDLNTATQAELEALPGVGPATAQAILAWRRDHGRFTRVEELQEVDGIGPKTFSRLAPLVTV